MTDDLPLSDDDREQYEEQLAQLSEKEIWLEMLVELKTIRYQNQQALGIEPEPESDENDETTLYECAMCGRSVPGNRLRDHATDKHNWNKSIRLHSMYSVE